MHKAATQTHETGSMDRQQSNVDRFLKLGYFYGDILRVLESLRHDAQTNDILEELIKTGRSAKTTQAPRPGHSSPQLVARGCSSPQPPQPSLTTQEEERDPSDGFRPIVIDGSNVAMSHGNKQVFSCRGVQLAVRWFLERGHCDITVFVPLWRKEQPRPEAPIADQHILHELEKAKILVFTPSRCVNGKRVVCYDDRYIVKLAYDCDGIIVSNDNYRDLQIEKPQWKRFIEERLLMYTFANDKFMPPDDPLGRNGPIIDNFLRKKPKVPVHKLQHCPYGKKCTYGVKCKFYHPERNQSQLSVADELRAKNKLTSGRDQPADARSCSPVHGCLPLAPTSTHATFFEQGQSNPSYSSLPSFTALSSQEAHQSRFSPSEQLDSPRETGSPAHFRKSPTCPSPDIDEAFGSFEGSMSRLYIQEQGCMPGGSYCSSGALGPNQSYGSGDHFLSSAPCSYTHRPGSGGHVPGCCCAPYTWQQNSLETIQDSDSPSSSQGMCCHQHPRSSYRIGVHSRDTVYCTEEHHFKRPVQHERFPPDVNLHSQRWGQSRPVAGGMVSGTSDSRSEQSRNIRTQLSTLFPQPTVDQVMGLHPHNLDMSQLVLLIHKFRTSHVRL